MCVCSGCAYICVCVHVYTYVSSRAHTSVFQLDTRLCSRRTRVCYQMNTRVCLCFPRAHKCVCSHVQYTCVCCTCAHVCVHVCAFASPTCTHMCVHVYTHVCSNGHVFVFQVNTCLFSDEHSCVCVFRVRVYMCVFTCTHMCVHMYTRLCSN